MIRIKNQKISWISGILDKDGTSIGLKNMVHIIGLLYEVSDQSCKA